MTKRPPDSEKLRVMRHATAMATSRYTISGAERKQQQPKPVTLPKLKCLEEEDE